MPQPIDQFEALLRQVEQELDLAAGLQGRALTRELPELDAAAALLSGPLSTEEQRLRFPALDTRS